MKFISLLKQLDPGYIAQEDCIGISMNFAKIQNEFELKNYESDLKTGYGKF